MKYSNRALIEIFYPIIITIGSLAILIFTPVFKYLNFENLAEVGIGIYGIFIGFFVTVLTIINSIENEYIRALKTEGNFKLLSNYLKSAIWFSLYSIILSVIYLFVFVDIKWEWVKYIEIIFSGIFIYALATSYRFISVFLRLTIK